MHSTLFSPSTRISDTPPPSSSIDTPSGSGCGESHREAVGDRRHDSAAEDELDDAIRDLRTLAALAEDRGDIETAKDYTRRSLEASASRTPAHKDRLAREHLAMVERSLDEGVDYFQAHALKSKGGAFA